MDDKAIKTLALRAKEDNEAFEQLYEYFFGQIYGYIFKRVGSRESTEDIVSDVFMKVFTGLDKYRPQKCSFGAWVYRIATNCLVDHYRKSGKKKTVELNENIQIKSDVSLESQTDITFEAKQVNGAIDNLPAKYQKVIYLKFYSQFSNIEIAEVLGISTNNAGVLVYRALQSFKKNYEKYAK